MSLIGNYSVLNKSVGRALGGPTVSENRSNWGTNGSSPNRFLGDRGGFWPLAATPIGYLPPYCWDMPWKAGAIASNNQIHGSSSVSGPLYGGINLTSSISASGAITTALAELIVSLSASTTGSGQITDAGLNGSLTASAALTGVGTLEAVPSALVDLVADLTGSGTVTVAHLEALGIMSADLTLASSETLTVDEIAAAVWAASIDINDDDTTMAAKMRQMLTTGKFVALK